MLSKASNRRGRRHGPWAKDSNFGMVMYGFTMFHWFFYQSKIWFHYVLLVSITWIKSSFETALPKWSESDLIVWKIGPPMVRGIRRSRRRGFESENNLERRDAQAGCWFNKGLGQRVQVWFFPCLFQWLIVLRMCIIFFCEQGIVFICQCEGVPP